MLSSQRRDAIKHVHSLVQLALVLNTYLLI